MNTMTMANALKAVFGAQTLTTASYFPACAQDGTPSGVISAANLASVLGDLKGWNGAYKGELRTETLPLVSGVSLYKIHKGNNPNIDSPVDYGTMIVATDPVSNIGLAIACSDNSGEGLYFKVRWGYSDVWAKGGWSRIAPTT